MVKRIICLLLSFAVIAGITGAAFADEENKEFQTKTTYNLYAEQGDTSVGGDGTTKTMEDTRTQAQKADDANRQTISDIADWLKEMMNQNPGFEFGDPTGKFSLEWQKLNGSLPGFNEVILPEYTLDNKELPEYVTPDFSMLGDGLQIDENNQNLDYYDAYYEDHNGINDPLPAEEHAIVIQDPAGCTKVDQKNVPSKYIAAYAYNYGEFNDSGAAPFKWPSYESDPRITDQNQLVDYNDAIAEIQNQMNNEFADKVGHLDTNIIYDPNATLSDIMHNPSAGDLQSFFPNKLHEATLPGTNTTVLVPNSNQDLYDILMWYLQQTNSEDIRITRYTQYNVKTYSSRTLRYKTPLSVYTWEIQGEGKDTQTHVTGAPNCRVLFLNTGVYQIDVYNTQEVVRQNVVSGQKTEVWTLSNGDIFNGLVIYCNSKSFRSVLSVDLEPTTEKVKLIASCFTAKISPEMLNQYHYISNGELFTAVTGDYTTERIR